jgi:putative ABC transport system substrate-binding protein
MRRREFIAGLAGVVASPFAGRAQEPGRTYRLGIVSPSGRGSPPIIAFFDELRRGGFVEGQNLSVIPSGLGIADEQYAEVSAALVQAAPDVIVSDARASHILKQLTRTIPIVAMGEDIVGDGLVASLARPGGNVTGISILSPELDGKRQDLLIEAVPGVRRIAALADANAMHTKLIQQHPQAARARGVELSIVPVHAPAQIAAAIDGAKSAGVQALNVLASPLFGSYQTRSIVMERAAALRLPAIYQWPDMAEEGGLLAYGPRFTDIFRQRARTVMKVLRGTRPAEIPVEQPTHFELVINIKAAKTIGHEIPAGLVLRADKLIE